MTTYELTLRDGEAFPGNKELCGDAIAFEPKARDSECDLILARKHSKRIEQAASVQDVKALLWLFDGLFAVPLKKGHSQ